MPVPTYSEALNTFATATAVSRRPKLVDNVFKSAPLWGILKKKNAIKTRGGKEIWENFIYAGFNSGSYGRGDEFNTEVTDFSTVMRFKWKHVYTPCNLDVIDVELNDSPEQVFDLVDAALNNAELSLINELGEQVFGDGTGNAGKDLDGLAIACSQTGTYGGITRTTTDGDPGKAIRAAVENTTGGVLSLSQINQDFGSCVVGQMAPDMILTTQNLWNRIWDRSQPSERNQPGQIRDIGFRTVNINGAEVVVDSHCPAGAYYILNTDTWVLHVHPKNDFRFRGFMEPTNQQRQIGQLLFWGNLVCVGPRYNGRTLNVTETA